MAAISPPRYPLFDRFAIESYPMSRGFIEWNPNTNSQQLLIKVASVLGDYLDLLPLSIRQVFYRLVAIHDYPKTEKAYGKLIYLLGKARRAKYELVDPRLSAHNNWRLRRPNGRMLLFDAIRDDKFVHSQPGFYEDANHFFHNARLWARGIRLDRQKGQPRQLVFWCEAKGMIPMLEGLVHAYGIPVFSCGGVDSVTAKYKTAMLWVDRLDRQPITILHIGDQDPMGLDLMLALAEDLISFCGRDADIEFIRLAITPEQAATGGERGGALISAPPKEKANKAKGYNKMLIHLSTTGDYHTYEPGILDGIEEDIGYLDDLEDTEALNDYIEEIEVGGLLKVGQHHLFSKIDSRSTWQAEALDPRQFKVIVDEAIEQRLDAEIFDAVILKEIEIQQEVLDELPAEPPPPRRPLRRSNQLSPQPAR